MREARSGKEVGSCEPVSLQDGERRVFYFYYTTSDHKIEANEVAYQGTTARGN